MMNTKYILTTFICSIAFTVSQAQESAQKVIILTASSFNASHIKSIVQATGNSLGETNSFSIGTEVAYGKWKKNNMWFWGIDGQYLYLTTSGSDRANRLAILPVVGYQFRTPITKNLFFAQVFKARMGYSNFSLGSESNPLQDQKLRGVSGSIVYYPLCILFDTNKKINIVFQLGEVSFSYERVKYIGGQNDGVVTNSFDLTGQLSAISFGVQFKLN